MASSEEQLKVFNLMQAYKNDGHLIADLDPLKNAQQDPKRAPFRLDQVQVLQKEHYGFTDGDLDKLFYIGSELPIGPVACLGDIVQELRKVYCGVVGVEFSHLIDLERSKWMSQAIWDLHNSGRLTEDEQRDILNMLVKSSQFESFCGTRFSGAKRFSLEGSDVVVPLLEALLQHASDRFVNCVELGMTHRGRLDVIHNVLGVPFQSIVKGFQSYLPDTGEFPNNSDDVRYHLGCLVDRKMKRGRLLTVSLAANPSHLEAVNSVVLGKTRARQFLQRGNEGGDVVGPLGLRGSVDYSPHDRAKHEVMALLIHGDASFYQGSVRESLGFSNLRDYTTGGTIHIIINNQIGFTTMPKESHSSVYCSDVAKSIGAPIVHVNGDHPEAAVRVARLAVDYRQKFGRDIVINVWSYRRHGHNEQDNPELTQPLMYGTIKTHPKLVQLYADQLVDQGTCTHHQVEGMHTAVETDLLYNFNSQGTDDEHLWNELRQSYSMKNCFAEEELCPVTGVDADTMKLIGDTMFTLPDPKHLHAHRRIVSHFRDRKASLEQDKIRWSTAEALAFGTLLMQGFHVRLSGQDVERGTFNQRHAVVYDQRRSKDSQEAVYKPWTALQTLWDDKAHEMAVKVGQFDPSFDTESVTRRGAHSIELERREKGLPPSLGVMEICNSPLSEEAVLGFEHGYSLYSNHIMVIWEAQFGDFANCAQTMIDTYIASGESKWLRSSSLVMLLPHGYEGQGPDHSSAKVERFLQLTDDRGDEVACATRHEEATQLRHVNMQVVNCSTPAQYYHVLKRTMLLPFRKPMVVFTPKYLLHHANCVSALEDFGVNEQFQEILEDEANASTKSLAKVVLCSGKLRYHIRQKLRKRVGHDIVVVSLEQLCPFPSYKLRNCLKQYVEDMHNGQYNGTPIIWAQEEPRNMGAFSFVKPRIEFLLKDMFPNDVVELNYVGRATSANPATGSYQLHVEEMDEIIKELDK